MFNSSKVLFYYGWTSRDKISPYIKALYISKLVYILVDRFSNIFKSLI